MGDHTALNGYGMTKDMREVYLSSAKFAQMNLSENEREKLFSAYGYRMEALQPLTEAQAWFFSENEFVSPNFLSQVLYKVSGELVPSHFSMVAEELIKETAALRTNFFFGEGRVLQVIRQPRPIYVTFHSLGGAKEGDLDAALASIMEADRRRGFNLEQDRLLRLAVFHTGMREYAVLVTQPQVIADAWDVRRLFEALFADARNRMVQLPPARKTSFSQYLQQQEEKDPELARKHWRNMLRALPPKPVLPGYESSYQVMQQEVRQLRILPADAELLYSKAQGNRTYIMAALQTVWGIVLQQANQMDDTYFGVVLSSRQANLKNVGEGNGAVYVMPVRMICEPTELVSNVVKKVFQQVMVSQPLSYCRKQELELIAGKKTRFFDHALNFHSFFTDTKPYSETAVPEGATPVAVMTQDTQGMDLEIYFRNEGGMLSAEFVYNANCFGENGIAVLMQKFAFALHTLLQEWQSTVYVLKQKLAKNTGIHEAVQKQPAPDEIREFLHSIELFSGLSAYRVQELAKYARLKEYLENDTILFAQKPQPDLLFVMHGKVMRSRDAGDGWQNPLDIISERCMVNEYALLGADSLQVLSAQAMSARVVVMALPVEKVLQLITEEPEVMKRLLGHLFKELNKYQKRWVLS